MLDKIAKFLDLDPNTIEPATIIEEFNHKYNNSWIKIDGIFVYINRIRNNKLELIKYKEKDILIVTKFKTIENFTPKTGIYKLNEDAIYLYRIPKRQWIKGFSLGINYSVLFLNKPNKGIIDDNEFTSCTNILFDENKEYFKESGFIGQDLFIHWQKVGTMDKYMEKLHITQPKFMKEVQELWPQLRITLDAPFQPKHMEEKLRVDF